MLKAKAECLETTANKVKQKIIKQLSIHRENKPPTDKNRWRKLEYYARNSGNKLKLHTPEILTRTQL